MFTVLDGKVGPTSRNPTKKALFHLVYTYYFSPIYSTKFVIKFYQWLKSLSYIQYQACKPPNYLLNLLRRNLRLCTRWLYYTIWAFKPVPPRISWAAYFSGGISL
jgi:hypothetical protein